MDFKLKAPFQPTGDQPEAVKQLVEGVQRGLKHQVLLGATATGKTFTVASIIQELQKPALIMAHNKTLAAQLYAEFREFFPDNAVSYFVSYYDYYQPEAYVPRHDLYIEKETEINEEIERLRLAATTALMSRRDVIIVASVSCIYGLGNPEEYGKGVVSLKVGEISRRNALIRQLAVECGYTAASIRERIYSRSPGQDGPEMAGVLIYTAAPDSEGTLGGLVEAARRIKDFVRKALELASLCSNDPICAHHQPGEHDHAPLLGAACHGCLLVPETSCEQHNEFLDRALVVCTVEGCGTEFFTIP